MPALIAAWSGLISLAFAVVNLTLVPFEWRLLVMQIWGIVDALPLTLGILVLWAYRKEGRGGAAVEAGIQAQRLQARAAIVLASLALALNCAYLLWYYQTHVRPGL